MRITSISPFQVFEFVRSLGADLEATVTRRQ
jgi:hypothetical protein